MASLAELRNRSKSSPPSAGAAAANNTLQHKIELLEANAEKLAKGAGPYVNVAREIQAAIHMLGGDAQLHATSAESLLSAVSTAINSGLGLCNGHGFLGAEDGQAKFIPGWRGLIDLVHRTGRASAWTGVAYAGDQFDYGLGDGPFVKHRPDGESDEWRDATHVYACGRIAGQEFPIVEVWSIKKLIKHASQHGGAHYSHASDAAMESYARKIVLLKVLRYLPSSPELETAMAAEFRVDAGAGRAPVAIEPTLPAIPESDHPALREFVDDASEGQPAAAPAPAAASAADKTATAEPTKKAKSRPRLQLE